MTAPPAEGLSTDEALSAAEIARRLRDPARRARAEPTATEGHEEVGKPVAAAVLVPVVLHPLPRCC
ncbi:hypothetical protein ACFQU7_02475 [Pseudoroseomonas wenyumeiae]